MRFFLPLLFAIGSTVFAQADLSSYVNPFIGTGGHGHTYPGATVPFGMVQLSPDTRIDGSWDGCSGYHFSDSIIYGFSHTHLSGTGVSDYGDLMLLPTQSFSGFDPSNYGATFDKSSEKAQAGLYEVKLKKDDIDVRLTASTRVGFHEYTFNRSGKAEILIDLNHRDKLLEGEIIKVNSRTYLVKRRSEAWARDQYFFARIEFDQPVKLARKLSNGKKSKKHLSGTLVKATFQRKVKAGDKIKVKVAISFTGFEGATKNAAEISHWNFDQQVTENRALWNQELKKIEVESNVKDQLVIFYTALYHTMTQPNIAQDVDGWYRGRDNELHQAQGFDYYTVFSLWDTFRATHPLYTLIDKKRTADFINTFLIQYEQGGRLPVWEFASNETDCMIGYHSVSVMADAMVKGIPGFDYSKAYEAAKHSANLDHLGLEAYKRFGFIGIEHEHESVSKTLEYAYDDWCIAQMAITQGDEEGYKTFDLRSQYWKNLFDQKSGFIRPRKNGRWDPRFDPREVNNSYTEGNGWQYTFFVPQDITGMIQYFGGAEAFENKLDEMFSAEAKTVGREQVDITGLVGQYAHGNEPSHHMAYLYNFINKPEKTTKRVHQLLNDFYTTQPDGLIGNEDCGQMSAWYVLSSIGLYSVTPGKAEWQTVEPIFDRVIVHLEDGSNREITRSNYQNNTRLGWERVNPLPIFNGDPLIKSPLMSYSDKQFSDTLHLTLEASDEIYFRTLYPNAKTTSTFQQYHKPFVISESCTIETYCQTLDGFRSHTVNAAFYKKPNNYLVELKGKYNPQYHAGGAQGLVDGVLGDENWRKGDWQGYQSQDFECIIDLRHVLPVKSISMRCLQDTRSWILMPTEVEFYASVDGSAFTLIGTAKNTVPADDYDVQITDFSINQDRIGEFQFIRVVAKNFGSLPKWHQGFGGDAFIFVDEIMVK